MNINDLNVGSKVNITTKAYQVNYNSSLKKHNHKLKKKYTDEEYKRDKNNDKKTRPIVIIHNDKNKNFIIAVSESSSKNKSQIRNNYKNGKNKIWKFELLLIKKENLKLVPVNTEKIDNFIWEKYQENEIKNFLGEFKKRKEIIYKAIEKHINEVNIL
ncbi:MAG: hypothetical protein HPAVJP_1390 [Candidatus Hepatoplasma vulgare]|nr:MAG: hypothetical protein HPAVJP_1390 [Candidatus Hepatoplasma sp.]